VGIFFSVTQLAKVTPMGLIVINGARIQTTKTVVTGMSVESVIKLSKTKTKVAVSILARE
jgi:hypothetical protein